MFGGIRRPGRRTAAALAVLTLHLGAAWLLLQSLRLTLQQPESEVTSVWLFPDLALSDPATEKPAEPDGAQSYAAASVRKATATQQLSPVAQSIETQGSTPTVDWRRAASDHVKRAGDKLQAGRPRGFGAVPSPQFRKCKPPKTSFEWDPDALRTGIEAFLPTFRVGKRCMVMPPFFSCALGELPPPNSHLLHDMKNPDRDHNSVPGSGLCGEDKSGIDAPASIATGTGP